jgi:hypothetical protein
VTADVLPAAPARALPFQEYNAVPSLSCASLPRILDAVSKYRAVVAGSSATTRRINEPNNTVHIEPGKEEEDALRRLLYPSDPEWTFLKPHGNTDLVDPHLPSEIADVLRRLWAVIIADNHSYRPPFSSKQRSEWLTLLDEATQTISDELSRSHVAVKAGGVIISLGECMYRVEGHRPVEVLLEEDNVLQAFLEKPAMRTPALLSTSGQDEAVKILKRLRTAYQGIFSAAIHCPGRAGKTAGGYHVCIRVGK